MHPNNNPDHSDSPELGDKTPEVQAAPVRRDEHEKLDSASAVVADLMALGVIDGAEGRGNPERAPEKWTVDELRQWLSTTRAHDGSTLESRLEGGSLDAQVQTYVRAFADGLRGFELDPTKLRFPHDALTLARLKEGIEFGAITGLVIEAYPDAAQLEAIAQKTNPGSRADEVDRMLRESVTDFLASHFQARGGKLLDGEDEESRLAYLRMRKWPRNGEPLWKAFHERAAQNGHNIATDYLKAGNDTKQAYKDDHAAIYADLDVQPTVQEMLGTVSVVFTNTKQHVSIMNKILGADGVTTLAQGYGLSSITLFQHKVDTLSPAEQLALVTGVSNPADTSTYPDQKTWVWLAGLDPQLVARANSGSYGLHVSSMGAGEASSNNVRVRSVVR